MCTTLYFYFCVYYSVLTPKNLISICHHTVGPLSISPSPPTLSPLVTTNLFFFFCEFMCLFVFEVSCMISLMFLAHIEKVGNGFIFLVGRHFCYFL